MCLQAGLRIDVHIYSNGALYFDNRISVPQGEVRQKKLAEAHNLAYSIHPEGTKMYQDLKHNFWWLAMREIAPVCGQVLGLPADKDRILENSWTSTAIIDTRMEVGTQYYEFCHTFTPQS